MNCRMHMAIFEGQLDSLTGRFAIVAARFNGVVTQKLVEGALATLTQHGVAEHDIDLAWVPATMKGVGCLFRVA